MKERMNINEAYKYLRIMQPRYRKARRKEKGRLLTEMQQVTSLHRKYLIQLMNGPPPQRKRRSRQRGRKYGAQVDDAIRVIGKALDWVCAERLKPALPKMARHLAKFGELRVTAELLEQLEQVSISTLRRIVNRVRQDEYRLPQRRGRPRYTNSVTARIPAGRIPWNIQEAGHFEVDLVHHGQAGVKGDYVHTVQFIDVCTGWSERVGVLGRSYRAIEGAFATIISRCPLPIREIHPDNGSEFMNHHLYRYFGERLKGAKLSRSRPWQKNDNRFVEQKNYSLVRAYLGHMYLHTSAQSEMLNDLYQDMWLYYNLFQPVMRQCERKVISTDSGIFRIRRRQDSAKTPMDRLLQTQSLDADAERHLLELFENTNPKALRETIYKKIDRLAATTV